MSLLRLDAEFVEINCWRQEQQSAEFLALSPEGRVPVIDDDGVILTDSIDILLYLASTYGNGKWLPQEDGAVAKLRKNVDRVVAQMEDGLVAARQITLFDGRYDADFSLKKSHELLATLEHSLIARDWMAGARPSVADVAFYTFVYLAPEGRVSLAPYPRLRRWLRNVESLPYFLRMTDSHVGLKKGLQY